MKKLWNIIVKFVKNTWKIIVGLSVVASLVGVVPVIVDYILPQKKLESPKISVKTADTVIHVHEFTTLKQPEFTEPPKQQESQQNNQQITPNPIIIDEPSKPNKPDIKSAQERRERQDSIQKKYNDEMKKRRERFKQMYE